MSEQEQLKPCPFCGGNAELDGEYVIWGVECQACLSATTGFRSAVEAIKAWNARAQQPAGKKLAVDFTASHIGNRLAEEGIRVLQANGHLAEGEAIANLIYSLIDNTTLTASTQAKGHS